MKVIYAGQDHELESTLPKIFLAGPSPRPGVVRPSWRGEAIDLLKAWGFNGIVYNPEYADGTFFDAADQGAYDRQGEWEDTGLDNADAILFWVPTDKGEYPGLTTRVEFGEYYKSRTDRGTHKVAYGRPDGSWRVRALDRKWIKETGNNPCDVLSNTLNHALTILEVSGKWDSPRV